MTAWLGWLGLGHQRRGVLVSPSSIATTAVVLGLFVADAYLQPRHLIPDGLATLLLTWFGGSLLVYLLGREAAITADFHRQQAKALAAARAQQEQLQQKPQATDFDAIDLGEAFIAEASSCAGWLTSTRPAVKRWRRWSAGKRAANVSGKTPGSTAGGPSTGRGSLLQRNLRNFRRWGTGAFVAELTGNQPNGGGQPWTRSSFCCWASWLACRPPADALVVTTVTEYVVRVGSQLYEMAVEHVRAHQPMGAGPNRFCRRCGRKWRCPIFERAAQVIWAAGVELVAVLDTGGTEGSPAPAGDLPQPRPRRHRARAEPDVLPILRVPVANSTTVRLPLLRPGVKSAHMATAER